jgi:hypothetical protein
LFLKPFALRNIDMDANRALATEGDLAQLFSEARALSSDTLGMAVLRKASNQAIARISLA